MGEEGIIILSSFKDEEPEYFIMFKENDHEQLIGLPFQIWDEGKNKFVDDNNDINPFVNLTKTEIDFIDLKDGFITKI